VLFIDEIDVVGSREHKGYGVIINQLLTEIDGFSTELTAPVFIIAATNRPQDLDPALVRAGRIDIHIHVPTLDREARSFFIKRYFELPHDGSLEEETLLSLTSGMSGAELEQTRREVVLEMIRQDLTAINQQMLMEFINQRKYGHRATVQRTLDDLTSTAYHEAGHAVVSRILNPETIIEQISITSRGNMAGFVAFVSDAQRNKRLTAQEVLEEMAVLLAGRCAEVIQFGQDHICAGASSDLAKASTWAFEAISVFGLDAEIGLISLAGLPKEIPQAYNQKILERIDFWLKAAEAISVNTLKQHWQTVERLVVHLLSQDVISGTVLEDIMKNQVDSSV
jgi:ATP-dependent Zn protease